MTSANKVLPWIFSLHIFSPYVTRTWERLSCSYEWLRINYFVFRWWLGSFAHDRIIAPTSCMPTRTSYFILCSHHNLPLLLKNTFSTTLCLLNVVVVKCIHLLRHNCKKAAPTAIETLHVFVQLTIIRLWGWQLHRKLSAHQISRFLWKPSGALFGFGVNPVHHEPQPVTLSFEPHTILIPLYRVINGIKLQRMLVAFHWLRCSTRWESCCVERCVLFGMKRTLLKSGNKRHRNYGVTKQSNHGLRMLPNIHHISP